jgi:hypothetical protein
MEALEKFRKALSNDEACRRYVQGVKASQPPRTPMEQALQRLREQAEKRGVRLG